MQVESKQVATCGPLNNVGSCRQRATECKLRADGMPFEGVGKSSGLQIAGNLYAS